MFKQLMTFVRDDRGATALEYALMAVGILLVVAAGVRYVGPIAADIFFRTGAELGG